MILSGKLVSERRKGAASLHLLMQFLEVNQVAESIQRDEDLTAKQTACQPFWRLCP